MHTMKSVLVLLVLLISNNSAHAQEQQSDAALQDKINYLNSVTLPVATELCTEILPKFASSLGPFLQSWPEKKRDSITRGRELVKKSLPNGKTIESHESGVIDEFTNHFKALEDGEKTRQCLGITVLVMSKS